MMNRRTLTAVAVIIALAPLLACAEEAKMSKVPESQDGADVVGTLLPLDDLRWVNTKDGEPISTDNKVTLVRWWTDRCPYCATSLPAIAALDEEFSDQGFQTVGVYHPKPPRKVKNKTVLKAANLIGYESAIAVDEDWAVLRSAYLDSRKRSATSVSFLLDGEGTIRYIHPGPELRPGNGADESDLQKQFDEMRQAIAALVAELPEASAE